MPRASAKHGYHHGDLSNAALVEVFALLSERGAKGVTFAEVARRSGVTAAALYRHYPQPEALLAAAATESFQLFERSLRKATGDSARERLRSMIEAYLAFSLKHAARYELMFSQLGCEKPLELSEAGESSFKVLVDALLACRADAKLEWAFPLAKQVWALCHGFALLSHAGALGTSKREAQELLWAGVWRLVEAE
jgi:AcrR family transcriptional regulator